MAKMRDLGLSYEAAAHGIQSAVRYDMSQRGIPDKGEVGFHPAFDFIKHLRVGVDLRAGEDRGLIELLIEKGIVTKEEYVEQVRISANEELARYEELIKDRYKLPESVKFR